MKNVDHGGASPVRVLNVFAAMNRGGAETMIMNIYRQIDRSKVQFDFIVHTQQPAAFDDEIGQLGGHIYRVPWPSAGAGFGYVRGWRRLLDDLGPGYIIEGHMTSTASLYLMQAKRRGMVTIAHSHSSSVGQGIGGVMRRISTIPLRWIADYLFAPSQAAAVNKFGRRAVNRPNYRYVRNPIPVDEFAFDATARDQVRDEFGLAGRFVVGQVGRFDQNKNQSFSIEVLRALLDRGIDADLLLVGDGESRAEVQAQANAAGLGDRVVFTGIRPDVARLMSAMDVLVLPSVSEGLAMVLLEAQANGLSSLVSDTVPSEAFVSALAQPESLTAGPRAWADAIMGQTGAAVERTVESAAARRVLKDQGFDNRQCALWLQEFYLAVSRGPSVKAVAR